jgi:hypothetical protein
MVIGHKGNRPIAEDEIVAKRWERDGWIKAGPSIARS